MTAQERLEELLKIRSTQPAPEPTQDPRLAQLMEILASRTAAAPPPPMENPELPVPPNPHDSGVNSARQAYDQANAPPPQRGTWSTIGRGLAEGLAYGDKAPAVARQKRQDAQQEKAVLLQNLRNAEIQQRQFGQDQRQAGLDREAAGDRKTDRIQQAAIFRQKEKEWNTPPAPEKPGPYSDEAVAAYLKMHPPQSAAQVPGRDVPFSQDVEAQKRRMDAAGRAPSAPNSPFEVWRQQNPSAPINDWFKMSNQREGLATVAEKNALGFFDRMNNAETNITQMEPEVAAMGLGGQMRLSNAPNVLQTPTGKRYNQAQGEFINAALRRESGAAISDTEYARFGGIYFPKPGDDAATLAQKAQARQTVLNSAKTSAGRAFTQTYGEDSGPEKPGAGPKVGTLEGGFVFTGGDPADPKNWKKP